MIWNCQQTWRKHPNTVGISLDLSLDETQISASLIVLDRRLGEAAANEHTL
jgi:hypothetical protein